MPPKRGRPADSGEEDGSGSEVEASFSEASDDDGDDTEEDEMPSSGGSDNEGNSTSQTRVPVRERLRRVRSEFPVDRDRSLEWVLDRLGQTESLLENEINSLQGLGQPTSLLCTLHDYQLAGLRWLVALHRCKLSGILADEMGLGKTAQAIAILAHLRESGVNGPFLVVAPLSTLSGWTEQLRAFCPSLQVVTYTGNAGERAATRRAPLGPATVLLASYEPILADAPQLRTLPFAYVVLDEAHRLKSRESAVYRCLLDELGVGRMPRLLLTGTPLQNHPDELFSLLHFVAPQIFDDAAGFVAWVAEDQAAPAAAVAATSDAPKAPPRGLSSGSIAPRLWRALMLRRLKSDHLRLPPRREVTLRVPMSGLQRHWYRAVLEKNRAALANVGHGRGLVNILASLRKCCNHPCALTAVHGLHRNPVCRAGLSARF